MRVFSRRTIKEAETKFPNQRAALVEWYRTMKSGEYTSFASLSHRFGRDNVDKVKKCYVFDVGGNALRIVCKFVFSYQICYIKGVMTHAQYDKGAWRDKCNCDL